MLLDHEMKEYIAQLETPVRLLQEAVGNLKEQLELTKSGHLYTPILGLPTTENLCRRLEQLDLEVAKIALQIPQSRAR